MNRKLVIGSRGSQLALWQANHISSRLQTMGVDSIIQIIRTTGDHLQTASLVQAGGKGLFTKEIEDALLEGAIDLAVHSLKDLPTQNPPGLAIAAIPQREDARDALVGGTLSGLPDAALVGTSSNRRVAQLRALRPDLRLEPVRGNVDTRLRKQAEGQYDAIVLAVAGLHRLGLGARIAQVLSPEEICPAPGQGALAVQTRASDPVYSICAELNDADSADAVKCERAVLSGLGGGCQLPIGAYASISGRSLQVFAGVFSADGRQNQRLQAAGDRSQAETLGGRVAEELIALGAGRLLGAASSHEY